MISQRMKPDKAEVCRLYVDDGLSIDAIADRLQSSFSTIRRMLLKAGITLRLPGQYDRTRRGRGQTSQEQDNVDNINVAESAPPRAEPVHNGAKTVQNSAGRLAELDTRLQVVEAFMATLQAQGRARADSAVQNSADTVHTPPRVESTRGTPGQAWDDPADAKPQRWNLYLPHGLKRQIEAQAKTTGIPPSQLVQRLLIAALNGHRREEVAR